MIFEKLDDSLLEDFKNRIFKIFDIPSIDKTFNEQIKNKLTEKIYEDKLNCFLIEKTINILYVQVFKEIQDEIGRSVNLNIFSEIDRINPKNVLLCIFVKKNQVDSESSILYDSIHIHQYIGEMKDNVYFTLLNSLKPVVENFFLYSSKNQDSICEIMKSYSEYEFSLIQLQKSENIQRVKFMSHPVIDNYCQTHANWAEHVQQFKENNITDTLLKEIYNCMLGWTSEIHRILQSDIDLFEVDSCLNEHAFWKNKDNMLKFIIQTFKSPSALLSLKLLEDTCYKTLNEKLTSILISDKFISVTKIYNFLNTLNLMDITNTKTIDDLIFCSKTILCAIEHQNHSNYPADRLFGLSALIARDINKSILRLFPKIEQLSFDDFSYEGNIYKILLFHNNFIGFINSIKAAVRHSCENLKDKINKYNQIYSETFLLTVNRLNELHNMYESYQFCDEMFEILKKWISLNPFKEFPIGVLDILNNMPELKIEWINFLKSLDFFDFTKNGNYLWNQRASEYKSKLNRRDTSFVECIRILLTDNIADDERIDIFIHFTYIFNKFSMIQSIHSTQNSLVDKIYKYMVSEKDCILKSSNFSFNSLKKIFPLGDASLQLMNVKKMTEKYKQYMYYILCILGPNYKMMDISKKIITESNDWSRKNLASVYLNTLSKKCQELKKSKGFLYKIASNNLNAANLVIVNFPNDLIKLSFDEYNAKALGFATDGFFLPESNIEKYKCFKIIEESIKCLDIVKNRLSTTKEFNLISLYVDYTHKQIMLGLSYHWDSLNIHQYTLKLSEYVIILNEKADIVLNIFSQINQLLEKLKKADYKFDLFCDILAEIRTELSSVENYQFYNTEYYMYLVSQEVEQILFDRLISSLHEFLEIIESQPADREQLDSLCASSKTALFRSGCVKCINFDIRLENKDISILPSIMDARNHIYTQLKNILAVVLLQDHLLFNMINFLEIDSIKHSYKHLMNKLSPQDLHSICIGIEKINSNILNFCKIWTTFQVLWDVNFNDLSQKFKTIEQWLEFYNSINSFKLFRTSKSFRIYPFVIIRFKSVKTHINAKYNEWLDKIFTTISDLYNSKIISLYEQIKCEKHKIDTQKIAISSLIDISDTVCFFETQSENLASFTNSTIALSSVQKILETHNIPIKISATNIISECESYRVAHETFKFGLESQSQILREKVIQQSQSVIESVKAILIEWEEKKSADSNIIYEDAIKTSVEFEEKFKKSAELFKNISKTKQYLEIPETLDESYNLPFKLNNVIDELSDVKQAWEFVASMYKQIENIGLNTFSTFSANSLNSSFDTIVNNLKRSSSIKAYDCFIALQSRIDELLTMNSVINEHRAEFFKDRHWKILFSKLNVNYSQSSITISQLWSLNISTNKNIFDDVFTTAQGEFGLENYLSSIKDYWSVGVFSFIPFKNRFEVVNNWSEILSKLGDHINGLDSMRASPYFKGFSIEVEQWQEKLTFLLNLSEIWIDLQRKWIYLHGIFSDSSDISKLLSSESAKFNSCTNEFSTALRKISKDPFILNIFKIPDIFGTFEKLLDHFSQIQKALSKYLERERENFPRFYFVGDEDLLEILGNSGDIIRIQKHLKKMFPGITSLILNQTVINGILSKEGESITFQNSINIAEYKNIIDWLKLVEKRVSLTLALLLKSSFDDLNELSKSDIDENVYFNWLKKYPQQLIILSEKIIWCDSIEHALQNGMDSDEKLKACLLKIEARLGILPKFIQLNDDYITNNKMINLITNLVYFRNKTRILINDKIVSSNDFNWLITLRCYFSEVNFKKSPLTCCILRIADAEFLYGFEYLGLIDYIIQTPLIDNCFLAMTQAMKMRLGGSPFGPAGTGKTESVKALGAHLGRFVIVFNCDTNFDFQAMGRIFIGLCRVGAWGCFDEFNRLEERIISAVSQQINSIQTGLKDFNTVDSDVTIELLGKKISLDRNIAIFITMNPDYAGRSRLPNNLKRLFRSFAMTQPDRQLIAQVILYSQGLSTAEILSSKIVPLLKLCNEQLSQQYHYDFGLRTLKNILVSAGNIKRLTVNEKKDIVSFEQELIVQSVVQSILPKLTAEDTVLFLSIIDDIFPNVLVKQSESLSLLTEIKAVCSDMSLLYLTESNQNSPWLEKLLYLNEIIKVNHGIILVGETCTGKTTCWKVLLEALNRLESTKGYFYIIDPKAISKEILYGSLDPTTRAWTDGIFTAIIRNVIENSENTNERHWIILDGDIDPEWVENLNSTLDDNKLFTLPNGERLCLPPSIRIIFEVSDLKYATPATISRCGMVYFSDSTIHVGMVSSQFFNILQNFNLDSDSIENPFNDSFDNTTLKSNISEPTKQFQNKIVQCLKSNLMSNRLLLNVVDYCQTHISHCMEFNAIRSLQSMFVLISNSVREVYASKLISDISDHQLEHYLKNLIGYSLIWSFGGDSNYDERFKLCQFINESIAQNSQSSLLIDMCISFESGVKPWSDLVSNVEISLSKILTSNFMVSTQETVRNSTLILDAISENRLVVLCGPPGSGKSMVIENLTASLPSWDIIRINFSSTTTSDDLLRYLLQRCDYKKGPNNLFLCPKTNRNLIIFCDEINLSNRDQYGTQSAICLLRQLLELKGFYRRDRIWVKLERIKFVAACNPPSYIGRSNLIGKFLRHTFILYVDYPSHDCLQKIYFNLNSFLQSTESTLSERATNTMIEFYNFLKEKFTIVICSHYVFTPKDLTIWIQGIIELINNRSNLTEEDITNALFYEGLGVFKDRLVEQDEREIVLYKLAEIISKYFSNYLPDTSNLTKIFTNWITDEFMLTDLHELSLYSQTKLQTVTENLPRHYIFNQFLEISQYINRILYRHQGHLILVGKNGSGRKTVIKFVASLQEIFVFKARWHKYYSLSDFDEELRDLFKRIITKNEKVIFLIDESSALPPLFLERVNVLLSSGDMCDLYQDEKYISLISTLKEISSRHSVNFKDSDELYKWFVERIKSNLHFIFLFNDNLVEWSNKVSSYSNIIKKCCVKWCGNWSIPSLCEVIIQLIKDVDLSFVEYEETQFEYILPDILNQPSIFNSVIHSIISIHMSFWSKLKFSYDKTPSSQKYILFINQFKDLLKDKYTSIQEEHSHISTGLIKLEQTFSEVATMKEELSVKQKELEIKNNTASQKLSLMATEQQKAQITREEAMKLFQEVKVQSETITTKSKDIKLELSQVEPALEESKEALSIIDRNMLNEIRVMHTPSHLIKLAIGAVYELITGNNPDEWKNVRTYLSKDDFIQTVRNFKTESITPERRQCMNKYLQNEKFTPEQIARGSTTCVPLVKWVRAHIGYNDILMKIEPLRLELSRLELQKETKEKQAKDLQNSINELESKIEEYKIEYSVLIREIEEVKLTLSQIERKVSISSTLLTNLELEQKRWAASHLTFQHKKNCLIGNCILSAAFIVYFGNFDKRTRDLLWHTWIDILNDVNISFDTNLLRVEYLTTPSECMQWGNLGLPSENLCLENATILKYSKNFSFVIDPSGQAVQFLFNMYKERKAISTSFLNATFKKELESAVRFGNILIVNNAEFYDPILNNLIERDFKRQDNRNIITIAGQDIDLSPSFKIFLITSDPAFIVPSNIGSRMCVTNFTVTFSGLESQCLYQIFKNERPDLEEKRIQLTKLQGEYSLTLYNLQKKLLLVLNEAQGGLLDDDRVVTTLQQLNQQSNEINSKVEDSKNHLIVVNTSLEFYLPFATMCSSIYFLLTDLYAVNNLYHYSLKFFFDIFNSVFSEMKSSSSNDASDRLGCLIKILFKKLVERVIYGLLKKDKQLFFILLAKIYLKYLPNSEILVESVDFFVKNKSIIVTKDKFIDFSKFSQDAKISLNRLLVLKQFSTSAKKIDGCCDELYNWSKNSKVNLPCPKCWIDVENVDQNIFTALNSLLLCYSLSPNDSFILFDKFLNSVFGDDLLKLYYSQLNLSKVVMEEISSETPVILLSVAGYDPTSWIDDLTANSSVKNTVHVAMGSSESCVNAEKALSDSSKYGYWLVLKNIHLASHWIKDLEKKLVELKHNPNFRLFLTAEISSNLPSSLLRSSRFLTFEPPPGIKSCMSRTFNIISSTRFSKKPKERSKIYFLVAWTHAIITERLYYSNLGWSKTYDFSETDLRVAFDMVDSWVDRVAGDRLNLPPEKMPWNAMKSLLCLSIYGSYMENFFDSKILDSLVNDIFNVQSYDNNKILVGQNLDQPYDILIPDHTEYTDYVRWIENLPNQQNTSWLKLPKSAEYILQTYKLDQMLSDLLKITEISSKSIDQTTYCLSDSLSKKTNICYQFADNWLKSLPVSLSFNELCNEIIYKPITRFYKREFIVGNQILQTIRSDLTQIISYKNGAIKINTHINDLIINISISMIPKHWIRYVVPSTLSLNSWIQDFSTRLDHLEKLIVALSKNSILSIVNTPVRIGKFFFPEAFTTALRQLSSRKLKLPLEELSLKVTIIDSATEINRINNTEFIVFGLKILGSRLNNMVLELSEDFVTDLPYFQIEWGIGRHCKVCKAVSRLTSEVKQLST
ncbi:hypothetical protein HZS_1322, partial [Henneguya salminicola]